MLWYIRYAEYMLKVGTSKASFNLSFDSVNYLNCFYTSCLVFLCVSLIFCWQSYSGVLDKFCDLLFPWTCVSNHGFSKWGFFFLLFSHHGHAFVNLFDWNRAMALFLSCLYLCLLYGLYVPDWEYHVPTEPSSVPMIFSVSIDVVFFFASHLFGGLQALAQR